MHKRIAWALLLVSWACLAEAHTMTLTEVTVTFATPGTVDVKIGIDLTQILGSPDRYYAFVTEPEAAQRQEVDKILPIVLDGLRLLVGTAALKLDLQQCSTATANKTLILDSQMSTLTTFRFTAPLPASHEPIKLVLPIGAPIDYPVVYTLQIPSAQVSMTRWLEDGAHESEPYNWFANAPQGNTSTIGAPLRHGVVAPESLPWHRQAALYLRLGFRHIVPEGADHILFVLGLFFLGVTWRKLLSQTTVFTIAHATSLFLSTYGIFSLPSRYVEPAIALSISWIAIENVFKPRLGASRLAMVFGFGLVHGLGFASSLRDIPFPKHDFLFALLGFNFGVDLGQLSVMAVAFLLVGWFRHKPWFRQRIAIPASLSIALVGLVWATQRVIFYGTHS
jgi:hydrogenase/urease accessory protein HupE